jgi:hypothetical protein
MPVALQYGTKQQINMANWHLESISGTTITGFGQVQVPSYFENSGVIVAGAYIAANTDANEVVNISASNFVIGGLPTETVSGTGDAAVYTFVGGNVDAEVYSVAFSNEGIAGQPDNRVKVEVTLNAFPVANTYNNSTLWPNPVGSYQIYIDIDERVGDPPVADVSRIACIKTEWPHLVPQSVAVANLENITETEQNAGSSSVPTQYMHSGTAIDGETLTIAEFTHTISDSSNNYYASTPFVIFEGLNNQGYDYTDAYAYEMSFTYSDPLNNGTSQITAFNTKITYTPPQGILNPDPSDTTFKFCGMGHKAILNYVIKDQETVVTDHVDDVVFPPTASYRGGSHRIVARGTAGAKYNIFVEKKESTTSNNAAANGGYYNFSPTVTENERTLATSKAFSFFGDNVTMHEGTIGSDGWNDHYIRLPRVEVDTNYDIRLQPVGSTTFSTNVPQALGDAVINQYGFNIVTVKPQTAKTTYADYSAQKVDRYYPKNYKEDIYPTAQHRTILAKAGNVSWQDKTRILLNPARSNRAIEVGMLVTTRNEGGSSIITHGTKVAKIKGDVITLSNACTLPADTRIRFDRYTSNIIPFEFTMTAGGSETIALTSPAGDTTTVLAGNSATIEKTCTTVNNNPSIVFAGDGFYATTEGLAVGMIVKGDGITGATDPSDGASYTTVVRVEYSSKAVVVTHAQSLAAGTVLSFSTTTGTAIEEATLIDCQVSVPSPQTTPDTATIQGHVLLEEANEAGDLLINIDGLLTIS